MYSTSAEAFIFCPPPVPGEIRQPGPGRGAVLCGQRVPGPVRQLSEHQRRPVGHAAQHPPGPAGEQHGPQRGTQHTADRSRTLCITGQTQPDGTVADAV